MFWDLKVAEVMRGISALFRRLLAQGAFCIFPFGAEDMELCRIYVASGIRYDNVAQAFLSGLDFLSVSSGLDSLFT